MKRNCNICLDSVNSLRTDKWDKNTGWTVTICYDCQKVIQIINQNRHKL